MQKQKSTEEIWEKITEAPYEVSSHGRLRTAAPLRCPGGIVTWQRLGNYVGYIGKIPGEKRRVALLAPYLVAKYFIGPRPENNCWVSYKDGNRQNLRADNLFYTSPQEVYDVCSMRTKGKTPKKLTKPIIIAIRKAFNKGVSINQLKIDFDLTRESVKKIVRGISHKED